MELCHVCEFHLQQERHGHIFEQTMQTKMQKQRHESNRQDSRASTKARLSLIEDFFKATWQMIYTGHLEPIGQLAQDLSKARLSARCCLVEPNIELVEGIV